MLDPALVYPLAPVPHRRRQPEQPIHLRLPLPDERLGGEDQVRTLPDQGHELGRHRELQGLSETDLVGEYEARAMRPAVGVEGELDEVLLVLPEADLPPVDGRLDDRRCSLRRVAPVVHGADRDAAGETLEVLNHEVREGDRERRRPEGVELLLNPGDRLRRVVLPDELVVEAKGRPGLVRAAEKGGAPPVRQGDDPRFPVDQPEHVVGNHPNLELAGEKEVVEALESRSRLPTEHLGARVAPLAAHRGLGRPRDLHVGAREPGVADHPDRAVDALKRLARHLEDGRREVARDAVVAFRPVEAGAEEARVEPLPSRGVPGNHSAGSVRQRREAGEAAIRFAFRVCFSSILGDHGYRSTGKSSVDSEVLPGGRNTRRCMSLRIASTTWEYKV